MTDQRSKTSAINGKLGGRPKELEAWNGALFGETWFARPSAEGHEFESNKGRTIRIKKGAIRLIK